MNTRQIPVNPKTVVNCYALFSAFDSCITDYTDGKYDDDPRTPYETAQQKQTEYLLDEVNCQRGSKLLDIGCGNGRVLEAAQRRGAEVLGITISPEQVRHNNGRGLTTYLMNYRNLKPSAIGQFDCVIANGSIEHFAQLSDVLASKQDQIYRDMFKLIHTILKPNGVLATTVIHFRHKIDPREIAKGVKAFPRKSLNFHFAMLEKHLGGWYPKRDQLISCAEPYFSLKKRINATNDYHHTSEDWIRIIKKFFITNPVAWFLLLREFAKNPQLTLGMIDTYLVAQSWATQFRDWKGEESPTYLFRDTWVPTVFN